MTAAPRRILLVMTLAASFLVALAAIVAACVPQGGKGIVTNDEEKDALTSNEKRAGTMTDLVVADGVDTTSHWQSWCTQPTSAVYVEDGADDTLHFDIGEAIEDQDSNIAGCPVDNSQVQRKVNSTYGTSAAGTATVSVNEGDAYQWNGDHWDLATGSENGCYAPSASPVVQGSIEIDDGGYSIAGQDTETMSNLPGANNSSSPPRGSNSIGDDAAVLCVGPDPTDPNRPSASNTRALFFPMVVLDSSGNTAQV